MKNIFRIGIIFLLSAIITNNTYSQSLQIIEPQLEVNATTLDDPSSKAIFKNISPAEKQFKIKIEATLAPGFSFNFCCPYNCYSGPPEVMTLESDPFTLAAGEDTQALFIMHVTQKDPFNPVTGTCFLKAIAFVNSDPTDKVEYTAKFTITSAVSVNDLLSDNFDYLSLPSPNPASNFVNFKCNSVNNSYIEIYNSKGSRVYFALIISGSDNVSVNTNDFSSGAYNAVLTNQGKKIQKRNFVILK